LLLLTVLAAGGVAGGAPGPDSVSEKRLRASVSKVDPLVHLRALSGAGSRMTGYPGCEAAREYIEGALKRAGLREVRREPFQVIVPVDHGASLEVGGRKVPVHCCWPNAARTPQTEPQGLTGPLVWGGEGYYGDFDGKPMKGAVVLMAFNSSTRWLNAASLGARAIIFLEPDSPFRSEAEQKYLDVPLPVPRYYLTRKDGMALAGAVSGKEVADWTSARAILEGLGRGEQPAEGTVRARMVWEERTVYRVSGVIPGTDPEYRDRVLLYHSYYDAMSVVPALAPGAESALGVSTLLETARVLVENPPACTVKVMAVPGHFLALAGIRDYAEKEIFPRRLAGTESERLGGEPTMAVGLDLSTRSASLAAFYKGDFYNQYGNNEVRLQRIFAGFGDVLLGWGEAWAEAGGKAELKSGIVPREGMDWSSLLPGAWAFDSEAISMTGRPALTLATTGDDRATIGTPLDTLERMTAEQLSSARAQAKLSAYLLARTARLEDMGLKGQIDTKQIGDVYGKAIERTVVSYLPNVPVTDGVVSLEVAKNKTLTGVLGKVHVRSDDRGLFYVWGVPTGKPVWVTGFSLERRGGVVKMVGIPQQVKSTTQERKRTGDVPVSDVRVPFITCVSTSLFDLVDPLTFLPLTHLSVYDGTSNSVLRADEEVTFVGRQTATSSYSEPVAVIFTEPGRRIKVTAAIGAVGNNGLLLNSEDTEDAFNGTGYEASKPENFLERTSFRIARDMITLDRHRMRILERTGIRKQNVARLHQAAAIELGAAEVALERGRYDEFYRHARRAWALEERVYPDIQGTADDAVRGIIFYFAILLPFVIFAERLLVNFPDIRAKLTAIAVIFVISYAGLSFVHPAFRLSKTPIIILIGFFMCAVGLFIIGLLVTKFQQLTEEFRQRIATIHRADVARASAAMAAFILGISNMRKRKVRTLLTSVTLILLTFTILSFTSFQTLPATLIRYRSKHESPYDGVLIRRLSWEPVQEFVFYDIRNFFRTQGFRPALRSWYVSQNANRELQIDVQRADGEGSGYIAAALLGLSPEEKEVTGLDGMLREGAGSWFEEGMSGWPFVCMVPSRMAEVLGLDASDVGRAELDVLGKRLTVVGILDSDRLAGVRDLDRESLMPVDYVEQQFKEQQPEGTGRAALTATGEVEEFRPETEESEAELYAHMEPDRVLVIPNELAISMGASLRSVAVAAGSREQALQLVSFGDVLRQYAERVSLALYAGLDGQLYRMATRAKLSMGGIKALIVPIVIASLIVFNTMLGAVYERRREITIYASVGLAPVHISALFFAESCVFAVIGAMMGYLLGQTISRVLIHVPWLMQGMSLNYSSMSAVWSAFLVVGVVLASTIYPARLAASLSVPDETRKMVLEKPTGDVWRIIFPFTVSSYESLGLMDFLREYFESHDEDSIGAFSASGIVFERGGGGAAYALGAKVWVAPLDMGISQRIRIEARPDAEEPVITYLHFTLERLSGEFETWHRMNLGFLRDLRKQLLIWRLVTPEEKERLKEEGEGLLS
jgi:hypothetical protein